jgi:hypothetical protein
MFLYLFLALMQIAIWDPLPSLVQNQQPIEIDNRTFIM